MKTQCIQLKCFSCTDMQMTVFITGISSGLGKQLARSLLLDGHRIIGVSRRPQTDPIIQELLQTGNLAYFSADISEPENIPTIAARLRELGITLDRAVINAAVIHDDLNDSYQLDWDKTLESLRVNFLSSVVLVQKLLPFMRMESALIAISSLSVLCDLDPNRIGYPLSKISLKSFFNSLQLKCSTNPRFVVVNLGRMEPQARGFFTISYDQATVKIKEILSNQHCSEEYYFPLRMAILSFVLGKLPLRIRRSFIEKRRDVRLSDSPVLLRA